MTSDSDSAPGEVYQLKPHHRVLRLLGWEYRQCRQRAAMTGAENRARAEWAGDFEYTGGWYTHRLTGMRKQSHRK